MQREGAIGPFGRVGGGLRDVSAMERDARRPLAGDLVVARQGPAAIALPQDRFAELDRTVQAFLDKRRGTWREVRRRWEGQPVDTSVCGTEVAMAKPSEMDWRMAPTCMPCNEILKSQQTAS